MKKIYSILSLLLVMSFALSAQTKIYAPTLLSPANEENGMMPDVVLDWLAVTGITLDITYEAQLSTTSDFVDAITFPRTEFTSEQMSELKFGTLYFWRVRAFDGEEASDWSETWSFRITWSPVLTSVPSDGSMVYVNPVVSWKAMTGINKYQFQIDTSYAWHQGVSGVTSALNSTYIVNEADIWAVGDGGKVLHNDGSGWSTVESGVTEDLNDVWFVDATHGYAVGAAGTVIFYDGSSWSAQTSGTSAELFGVSFADATSGVAVGAGGVVTIYSNGVWTAGTGGTSSDIYDVAAVSENNVWACGKDKLIYHFDGTSWTSEAYGTKDFYAISFQDENNGWVVGKLGAIFHYDGATWYQQFISTTVNKDLLGVSVKDYKGYAVGKSGTILSFEGGWSLVTSATTTDLNSVHVYGDNFGNIVGASGIVIEKTDEGFNSPALKNYSIGVNGGDTIEVANLRFGQTYYYHLRAIHGNDTSAWSQIKSMTTQPTVELVSPGDGETVDMAFLLTWSKYEGVVDFVVEIDTQENFPSPQVFTSDTATLGLVSDYFGTEYFWRVAGRHSLDQSDWSEAFSLIIKDMVTLTSPVDGAVNVNSCPKFIWEPIVGSPGYQVMVSKSSDFTDPMISETDEPQLQCVSQMERNTTYYWKVRGTTPVDTSSWSAVSSFTTEGYIGINEYLNGEAISVYPNPNSGQFTITMESYSSETYDIQVADLAGRVVYSSVVSLVPGENKVSIELTDLKQGMYSINISKGDESITKKVLIN